MRLIVGGGRAAEDLETKGSVIVGVRTLSEGGRVGNFSREQVMMQYFPSEIFLADSWVLCIFHFIISSRMISTKSMTKHIGSLISWAPLIDGTLIQLKLFPGFGDNFIYSTT